MLHDAESDAPALDPRGIVVATATCPAALE